MVRCIRVARSLPGSASSCAWKISESFTEGRAWFCRWGNVLGSVLRVVRRSGGGLVETPGDLYHRCLLGRHVVRELLLRPRFVSAVKAEQLAS